MKRQMILAGALIAGVVVLSAACQTSTDVAVNSGMNNRNGMNSTMPANMSNMPTNDNSKMAEMMDMKS